MPPGDYIEMVGGISIFRAPALTVQVTLIDGRVFLLEPRRNETEDEALDRLYAFASKA